MSFDINLDISHHCPKAVHLWNQWNRLIPAVLQTKKILSFFFMFCLWKYIERWSAQVRLLHMFFVHIIIHIVKNGTWAGCARCFPVKHSYFAQKHWFIKLKLSSWRHFYIMKSLVITLSTFTFNVISTIFNLISKAF